MLGATCSRNLVTPARQVPRRSHHEWHIPQSNQALARSRDLVTHAAGDVCRAHNRDGRRARPAHDRRARGPGSTRRCPGGPAKGLGWRPCWRAGIQRSSSTVVACGCDGQNRKTARNTSTCAVPIAPSPLPDWVEPGSPIGRAHARTRSLNKTDINPEEDASRTPIRRRPTMKKRHVQTGRRRADSDRRSHLTFTSGVANRAFWYSRPRM